MDPISNEKIISKFEKFKFDITAIYDRADVILDYDSKNSSYMVVVSLDVIYAIVRQVAGKGEVISIHKDCPPDIAIQTFSIANKYWDVKLGSPFCNVPDGVKFTPMSNCIYFQDVESVEKILN
jgi:hypothetical protein